MHRHIGGYRRQTAAVVVATGLTLSTWFVQRGRPVVTLRCKLKVHHVLADVVFTAARAPIAKLYRTSIIVITAPRYRSGVLRLVCLLVCLCVCVCPRSHLWNRLTDLHEISCADPLWPWLLGPSSVLPVVILSARLSVCPSV